MPIPTTIIDDIKRSIVTILNKPGSVVYSSANSICKGDLYMMGLNPGGSDKGTINQLIDELSTKTSNSYIDERWGTTTKKYEKGKHPLQKNYINLTKYLNNSQEVFSTNLIFTRSIDQSGANYPLNADLCWPAHQQFIKIVDPKCLLVFGISQISPYSYIKNKYKLPYIDKIFSEHGNWYCFATNGEIEGKNRLVIGVPHLSRYTIANYPRVMQWIKNKIDNFNN